VPYLTIMKTAAPILDIADESRRRFIKQFSLSTAASIIGGKLWTGRVLADVTPGGTNIGRVKINVADYPALAGEGGSVQFKFNNGNLGQHFPFTVSRDAGDVFHVVNTDCTHENGIVGPYIINADGNGNSYMECPLHFSQFTMSGQYISGQAIGNLTCFPSTYNATSGFLMVEIPNLLTKINSISVQSTTASTIRLRLQFPTTTTFVYKVQYQASLADAPVYVNFASSAGGTLNQTQFISINGGLKSIWVDATGTSGFYSIALIVTPYP